MKPGHTSKDRDELAEWGNQLKQKRESSLSVNLTEIDYNDTYRNEWWFIEMKKQFSDKLLTIEGEYHELQDLYEDRDVDFKKK